MSHIPEPDITPDGPAYQGRLLVRPDDEVVDQGASFDLGTLLTRRRILGLLGIGAGGLALAACGADTASTSSAASSTGGTTEGEIPDETNGPYPADGTNGVNILEQSGIVRRDITSSLDGGTTVDGVPLEFSFTITDMVNDAPFEGAAVYVWHCDAQGRYSMYTEGVEDETFLRGIQVADADGTVTFTTIVPGCYSGRWPHIHFEVYPDLDSATGAENAIATSQVAFPEDMVREVYQLDTYAGSTENLDGVGSLDNDNVFGDGWELEMGTFSGDIDGGYDGSLAVGIDTTTEPSMGNAPLNGDGPPDGGGPDGSGGPGGPGGTPPSGGPPSDAPSGS